MGARRKAQRQRRKKMLGDTLTLDKIRSMEQIRLEHLKERLEKSTNEQERRMLEKRIWMIQNS